MYHPELKIALSTYNGLGCRRKKKKVPDNFSDLLVIRSLHPTEHFAYTDTQDINGRTLYTGQLTYNEDSGQPILFTIN